MINCCLVFDIGKTNKKALLFSEDYQVLYETQVQFEEILDDESEHCDDIRKISQWVLSIYRDLLANEQYSIRAINFSTYGASLVYLDAAGKVIAPIYNYLKASNSEIKQAFETKHNSGAQLYRETSSPAMYMLNSGFQAFWLKNYKTFIYKNCTDALHFPQYLSFLFSGERVSEYTSLGCHTALWDFDKSAYHTWVHEEKLRILTQEPLRADHVFYKENLAVGVGIHDSSSALVPYLKAFSEPFVLISTGTWSVSLNPFSTAKLTEQDLAQDCLEFLSYEGKRVKASRIFSGNEHDRQVKHLSAYFKVASDYYKTIKLNRELLIHLRRKNKQSFLHEVKLGDLAESPFVDRNLNAFKNFDEAYHQLMLDLVCQQLASTKLAIGDQEIRHIIVEGGFAKNDIYLSLLQEAIRNNTFWISDLSQGSALGAAMVINASWNPDQKLDLGKLGLRKL
jgi:L-fuculokinase